MKLVYNWLNIIQDYLLPPTCILCGNPGYGSRDLCDSCHTHLPRNDSCCSRCAEPMESTNDPARLCGRCLSRPPAFDQAVAPFLYQGPIRHLIVALKFNADFKNARLLGMLLAEHLNSNSERPDLIIPIPLHKRRYRRRGFNQSQEIAGTVAKEMNIPLDPVSCRRHRDTPHQTRLPAKKRRKNMKNAFSMCKPIQARHVAIVDDVMTTGSTVHELAALLKKNGVARVDVWVCART